MIVVLMYKLYDMYIQERTHRHFIWSVGVSAQRHVVLPLGKFRNQNFCREGRGSGGREIKKKQKNNNVQYKWGLIIW